MSRRIQIYSLAVLLGILVLVLVVSRSHSPGISGVLAAEGRFQPLNIQDPRLRLDLLERIQKQEYPGTHRNIFSAEPPPLPPTPAQMKAQEEQANQAASVPPPLVVPATFFGYAAEARSGSRLAFFQSGDDVLILGEGGILLGRFRLLKIGNDSAELEEISSGRRTTIPMAGPSPSPSEQ